MELNVNLNLSLLVLISMILTACGRAPNVDRSRAPGVDSVLGQMLTKTKWCTPASTDDGKRPNFSTLDLRQTGKFFRSTYVLNDDRSSLKLESKTQGNWALLFDRLYTRINGAAREINAKVSVVEDTGSVAAKISRAKDNGASSTCVQLAVNDVESETLCPCDFINN